MNRSEQSILSLLLASFLVVGSAVYYFRSKNKRGAIVNRTRGGGISTDLSIVNPATSMTIHDSVEKKQYNGLAKLISKKQVSTDTIELKFKYSTNSSQSGFIPVGKHLKILFPNPNKLTPVWNSIRDPEYGLKTIERKYTPTECDFHGFTLVVKVYLPNENFISGGKCSQYLNSLSVGEEIVVELPYGLMEYLGKGQFKKSKQIVTVKEVGMIAGGSGITPMLRLLENSLNNQDDFLKFSLIFANKSEDDIILKSRLEELALKYSKRFKIYYILTRPTSPDWKGGIGIVNKALIESFLPTPSESTLILLCGPPKMIQNCCKLNLQELCYSKNLVWEF